MNRFSRVKVGRGSDIPPLSLMTLAALTPSGWDVAIVDEDVQPVDYDCEADLIGISLLTMTAWRGYRIADRFRERGAKVVLGGIHATVVPEEAARHADAVVIGEAEQLWHRVLADAGAGRLQRFYSSEGFCSMQGMPLPRQDVLSEHGYLTTNLIQTTRGCPHRCSFCSVHAISGNRYRTRPVGEVIAELETFDNPVAIFMDDNVVGNPSYSKRLFKAMIPLRLQWWGQVTLALAADDELLDLAAESGCKIACVGFESVSPASISAIGKSHTNAVSAYAEAVKKLHARGICVQGSLILGLDNDDTDVFAKTVEFVQDNNIDLPSICVLTPYPGTALFEHLRADGRLPRADWYLADGGATAGKVMFRPKLMSPEELEEGHRFVRARIHSLGAMVKRSMCAGTNPVIGAAFGLKERKWYKDQWGKDGPLVGRRPAEAEELAPEPAPILD